MKNKQRAIRMAMPWMGILAGVLVSSWGATACMAQEKCTDTLPRVRKILHDLKKQMPTLQDQIRDYNIIEALLNECREDPTTAAPHLQFEIDTLRQAIPLKIKQLEDLQRHRNEATGTPSGEPAKYWKMLYKDCYRSYVDHFDLVQRLKCDQAASLIHGYYDDAWHQQKINRFQTNIMYPPETIKTLWRLIYRLSQSECVDSDKGKGAIRRIFFPQPMDPEALGNSLSTQMQIDDQAFIRFVGAMNHLSSEKRLELLNKFAEIAKAKNIAKGSRLQGLLAKLSNPQIQNIESALSVLAKVPWTIDDSSLNQYVRIPIEKKAKLRVNDFLLLESPQTFDFKVARSVNAAFQDSSYLPNGYVKIAKKWPVSKEIIAVLSNTQTGQVAKQKSVLPSGHGYDLDIYGKIERLVGGMYRLYVFCINKSQMLLYSDAVDLPHDTLVNPELLGAKAKNLYMRLKEFIVIMKMMDQAESYAAVSYLKSEKPVAFIHRAVSAHAHAYHHRTAHHWAKVNQIVIEDHFWGSDAATEDRLGSDYKELIMNRIESLYYRSYHTMLTDEKTVPSTLQIRGEYDETESEPLNHTKGKEGKITIVYEIDKQEMARTDLFLPLKMISDNPKTETVKHIVAQTVCGAIAMFLNFNPGPVKLIDPVQTTTYHPMASFFMPGIWRENNRAENQSSFLLTTWNYSNIAFFGVTLGSASLYVGNDYEDDSLFWTAVGGTGLFLINGTIGYLDAIINGPRHASKYAGGAPAIPKVQVVVTNDSPALVVSIPF
jgi:hypothetical protein